LTRRQAKPTADMWDDSKRDVRGTLANASVLRMSAETVGKDYNKWRERNREDPVRISHRIS
jgi:hypothetical protein